MDDVDASQAAPARPERRPTRPTRDLPAVPPDADDDAPTLDSSSNGCPPEHTVLLDGSSVPDDKLAEEPRTQGDDIDSTKLTPIRAHYLKKSLISLEFDRELNGIFSFNAPSVSPLSYLGAPFTPPPKDAPPLDLPFLKYAFRQFIMPFPFLASAPRNFFPEKVQPFVSSLLSRNLSSTDVMDDNTEDVEEMTRKKLLVKAGKQLSLLLTTATRVTEPEELVRLTQADLNRLEFLAKKRQVRQAKQKQTFEVNIVCIRAVVRPSAPWK